MVVFGSMVVFGASSLRAQTGKEAPAVSYFLDEPRSIDQNVLPPGAKDLVVAKVRVRTVSYRGGRHPWDGPQPPPKTILAAQVVIVAVLRGRAAPGAEAVVTFGTRESTQKFKYPHTASMRGSEYFIVSYRDEDAEQRLVGFPIGPDEYESWDRERWAYERERGKPGHQDK
jgi:hypothetical protein